MKDSISLIETKQSIFISFNSIIGIAFNFHKWQEIINWFSSQNTKCLTFIFGFTQLTFKKLLYFVLLRK